MVFIRSSNYRGESLSVNFSFKVEPFFTSSLLVDRKFYSNLLTRLLDSDQRDRDRLAHNFSFEKGLQFGFLKKYCSNRTKK